MLSTEVGDNKGQHDRNARDFDGFGNNYEHDKDGKNKRQPDRHDDVYDRATNRVGNRLHPDC